MLFDNAFSDVYQADIASGTELTRDEESSMSENG